MISVSFLVHSISLLLFLSYSFDLSCPCHSFSHFLLHSFLSFLGTLSFYPPSFLECFWTASCLSAGKGKFASSVKHLAAVASAQHQTISHKEETVVDLGQPTLNISSFPRSTFPQLFLKPSRMCQSFPLSCLSMKKKTTVWIQHSHYINHFLLGLFIILFILYSYSRYRPGGSNHVNHSLSAFPGSGISITVQNWQGLSISMFLYGLRSRTVQDKFPWKPCSGLFGL